MGTYYRIIGRHLGRRRWVGELSAGGLSASTVRHIYRVFSFIVAMAVQDGRISPRPATDWLRVARVDLARPPPPHR